MPVASSLSLPQEFVHQYQRNLTELQRHQPEVAALLHQTALPENVAPATGRDGLPTFRISLPDGRKVWLGGSSMPSISAPEILAEIPRDGGSIILPAIMTGREALVLLDRLPRHAAVFVVEHQAANLKLALHLHDYVNALQSGRLVLIPVNMLAEAMGALWKRFPGYAMPTRLVTSPLIPQACVSQIQQLISEAAASVFQIQSATIALAEKRLEAGSRRFLSDRPRVAMIDAGRADRGSDRTAGLAAAMRQLGWPYVDCTADLPRHCDLAGALNQMAAFQPEVVLLLNGLGARWVERLPRDLPAISWFLPEAPLDQETPANMLDTHLVFASSAAQRDAFAECDLRVRDTSDVIGPDDVTRPEGANDCSHGWSAAQPVESRAPARPAPDGADERRLCTRGLPCERIGLCMDGITLGVTTDHDSVKAEHDCGPESSVIVAPTIDDRPEALNVTLPSHVRVWRRLQELARAEGSATGPMDATEWVRQAMGDVGMTADDEAVIRFFQQTFNERIAPAQQVQSALRELQLADPSVVVQSPEAFPFRAAPPCRVGTAHQTVLRPAPLRKRETHSLAVFPCDFSQRFACILGALANGISVVLRDARTQWEREYPGNAELLPAIFFYQTPTELAAAVQSAGQLSFDLREKITQRVRTGHSMANRLESMMTLLRRVRDTFGGVIRPKGGNPGAPGPSAGPPSPGAPGLGNEAS